MTVLFAKKRAKSWSVFLSCVILTSPSWAATKNVAQSNLQKTINSANAATFENSNVNTFSAGAAPSSSGQQQNAGGGALPSFFNFTDPSETDEDKPKPKQVYYGAVRGAGAGTDSAPPSLSDLQSVRKENPQKPEEGKGLPFDVRRDALREAAVSYGARGGLAWRTFQIHEELGRRAASLDRIYDFRQFLIPGPSGMMIESPIISEGLNALIIESGGQQAAVSDRIYNIINNAKIVSTPRDWRSYLERQWGEVELPPDILRPQDEAERKLWIELVAKGWNEGIKQADETFLDDLNRLMADFQGMIRYRALLAQGMVSPPYALQVDRGVTGDGDTMRVGDRAVQITGVPKLLTRSSQWQPANQ